MTNSITTNIAANVRNKPPLVVFTVCLLGIIITTTCLTYYVQTHDKITNVDAITDWLSLLKRLNKMDLCAKTTIRPAQPDSLPNDATTASLTIPGRLVGLTIDTNLNAQGIVHITSWSSKCPNRAYVPTYFEIEFDTAKRNESSNDEVCLTIRGPVQLMPALSPDQVCKAPALNLQSWAIITGKSKETTEDFCNKGSIFRVNVNTEFSGTLKYEAYLTKEDRIMINSHLIVTTCFLVLVVVLIVGYALIWKTAAAVENKQHFTKGMYL